MELDIEMENIRMKVIGRLWMLLDWGMMRVTIILASFYRAMRSILKF